MVAEDARRSGFGVKLDSFTTYLPNLFVLMLAGEGGMSLSILVLPRRCRWDQNGPAAGAGESQGFILASPVPSGSSVSCGRSWRVEALMHCNFCVQEVLRVCF